ncbi:MAG: hypothetical protein IT454_17260 [Planctomycetes bacterium]|nr:hypothetical protein [Planctomycetota bacterium]
MRALLRDVDGLLRGEHDFAAGRGRIPWVRVALCVASGGALHGAALGSLHARLDQMCVSALKLPLLIASSTALCIPSFYAINAVLGLREDFSAALRGVLATQATVAVVLASLAPIVALFSASAIGYREAVAVDGALYCAASVAGHVALARHYRPLIARRQRHAWARLAWLVLYWFVTIQLAWLLRPFVGAPGMPATFLRSGAWSNAYVVLTQAFLGS